MTKFQFLKSGPYHLGNGSEVSVDLRIKRGGGHPGFLVLGTRTGACVPRSDVMRRFPELMLSGGPRGRSDDDAAVFSAQRTWGVLSFSFVEREPDCLASVAFDPKNEPLKADPCRLRKERGKSRARECHSATRIDGTLETATREVAANSGAGTPR